MTQDPTPGADRAHAAKPARAIPLRPDGWPDWLGRRPMSSSDRVKIRNALDAGLPGNALTGPGPFLCYLTIDGLDHEPDPREATQCYSTHSTITIGIRGPDAQERVNQLRQALDKLIAKHGWTTRNEPR